MKLILKLLFVFFVVGFVACKDTKKEDAGTKITTEVTDEQIENIEAKANEVVEEEIAETPNVEGVEGEFDNILTELDNVTEEINKAGEALENSLKELDNI